MSIKVQKLIALAKDAAATKFEKISAMERAIVIGNGEIKKEVKNNGSTHYLDKSDCLICIANY